MTVLLIFSRLNGGNKLKVKKHGFTLIELLIVISIISVLASILFPVFSRAREKARQATCISNQRQLAAECMMYAQDHEECLPPSKSIWTDLKVDPGMLICPTKGKNTPNGYLYNDDRDMESLGKIEDPTMEWVTADGNSVADNLPNIGFLMMQWEMRHSGRALYSFADGHVSVTTPTHERLPVYLVLDCSTSMAGAPIQCVQDGISMLLTELKADPKVLEAVSISVITFNKTAQVDVPLTPILQFQVPTLTIGNYTYLGAALTLLYDTVKKDIRKSTATQKGDWMPLIFLMTDGNPNDAWEGPADKIRQECPATFFACGAGPNVNITTLKRITEYAFLLQDTDPGTFSQYFKWVSSWVSYLSD